MPESKLTLQTEWVHTRFKSFKGFLFFQWYSEKR